MLTNKDLEKLAYYWVKGFDVPWESLYDGSSARRISLPTYPFERRRCWLESPEETTKTPPIVKPPGEPNEDHLCLKRSQFAKVKKKTERSDSPAK